MHTKNKKGRLKEFQTQFLRYFFEHEENGYFLKSITPAGKLVDGKEAMLVYQKGYVFRLTEILGTQFEAVRSVLGEKAFITICEDYIRNHRSSSYKFSDYGREFSSFLAQAEHLREISFIADLARFELAFNDTANASEHEALAPTKLAMIKTSPFATLQFGPSVNFLALNHAIYEWWATRNSQEQAPLQTNVLEHLVLYKRDGSIFIEPINERSFHLLTSLKAGKSLGAYLNHDVHAAHLTSKDISDVFSLIVLGGLIEAITL